MTLFLENVTFDNDFFSIDLPDGGTLVLNKINEGFAYEGTDVLIDRINIEIDYEDSFVPCSSIIGLGDEKIKINTEYIQFEGSVLTSKNMKYCTIEVYE